VSLYTTDAIAKSGMHVVDVLNEKQSLSHFLVFCSYKSNENDMEQEELNTGSNILYQTCVSIHDSRNRKCGRRVVDVLNEKQLFSHFLDFCSDNFTENEVAQEELNTGSNISYQTCVSLHDRRNCIKLHSRCRCPERETVVKSLFGLLQ
jgi:hypothetical protein